MLHCICHLLEPRAHGSGAPTTARSCPPTLERALANAISAQIHIIEEVAPSARALLEPSPWASDWPGAGPIDLAVHDLPHASSTTEWWYLKAHVRTLDGRPLSLFAAFFRVLKGRDETTGELLWAHSLTWALSDPQRKRYVSESLVDRDAPRLGLEKIDRGEGTRDARILRAMREVCARGKVPHPDRLFAREPFVAKRRLELQFDDARLV